MAVWLINIIKKMMKINMLNTLINCKLVDGYVN